MPQLLVFKHCVRFEPRERPAIEDVVRRLERIIEDREAAPATEQGGDPLVMAGNSPADLPSPWHTSPRIATIMESFTSRIEDLKLRTKLNELCKLVEADLGVQTTSPLNGVYNVSNLLRFLYQSEMDVGDARAQIVLNSNARLEFKMDAKRKHIVSDDLSFDKLPRLGELQQYQPTNKMVGRAKDGRVISYTKFGANMHNLKEAFTIEEYVDGQ